MLEFPGGRWYEPADLGFNSIVIGAGAFVSGAIVPWSAGFQFARVTFLFELVAGPSADFTLASRALDVDGQTFLTVGVNLVSNMTISTLGIFSGNADVPRAITGVAQPSSLAMVIGVPYVQLRIINNDGVNPGTVSLRAFLGK